MQDAGGFRRLHSCLRSVRSTTSHGRQSMNATRVLMGIVLALGAATAGAQTGVYVVAGVGQGKASFDDADFTSEDPEFSRSTDTSSTTWNIGVGWRFHKHVAAELGYADLGKYSVTFTGSG